MARRTMSLATRFRVLRRDWFTCRYCGANGVGVVLHIDHVVPVSRGGTNDESNLRTACLECNLGKRDMPLEIEEDPVTRIEREAFERRTEWIAGLHVAPEIKETLTDLSRVADAIDCVYGLALADWQKTMPILRGLLATGLIEPDGTMGADDIVSLDDDGQPILSLIIRSKWIRDDAPKDSRQWGLHSWISMPRLEHVH